MKKIKLFVQIFLITSIVSFFCCISCAKSSKNNKQIFGGSLHIFGNSVGSDSNHWKALIDNENCSSSVRWAIEPMCFGLFLQYKQVENAVELCWSNLSVGKYNFRLSATTIEQNNENTFYSPYISLTIVGDSPVSGGSTDLKNQYISGRDDCPWIIIYNGINYSKNANWSIENLTPSTNKIYINYDEDKKGAIVSWTDLDINTYKFKIKCSIKTQIINSDLTFYTDTITLQIKRSDHIDISGGTHSITTSKSGKDSRKLFCYLNDNQDVSYYTTFSIVWYENWSKDDVYIWTNEKKESYISWNYTDESAILKFKIMAKYQNIITTSIDYFVIRFVK